MPEIIVRRNRNYLLDDHVTDFFNNLQYIVARVMSEPDTGNELSPADIVVRDAPHGPFDVGTMDLEIIIVANYSKECELNLKWRTEMIVTMIKNINPRNAFMGNYIKEHNSIYIMLANGVFNIF